MATRAPRYQSPQPPCAGEEGVCLRPGTLPAWVPLLLAQDNCLHVAVADVPQLLWEIARRAGDPYAMINKLVEVAVQRAGDDGGDDGAQDRASIP